MRLKNIKHVRFLFRVKKSQIQISLQDNEDGTFGLPFKYVEVGEAVIGFHAYNVDIRDREDYEIWYMETNNVHPGRSNKWFDVLTLYDKHIVSEREYDDILSVIIDNYYQFEGEIPLNTPYLNALDSLRKEQCKNDYIKKLQAYLDGSITPVVFDGTYIPMKEELVEEEIKTLAHFNPKYHDGKKPSYFRYYQFINYEDFGGGIKPFNLDFNVNNIPYITELSKKSDD